MGLRWRGGTSRAHRNVRWLYLVLTVGATLLGTWLTVEIRGVRTYYALVAGVSRVQAISLSDMLNIMIFAAVLSGNAVAAPLFLYRVLRHRDI